MNTNCIIKELWKQFSSNLNCSHMTSYVGHCIRRRLNCNYNNCIAIYEPAKCLGCTMEMFYLRKVFLFLCMLLVFAGALLCFLREDICKIQQITICAWQYYEYCQDDCPFTNKCYIVTAKQSNHKCKTMAKSSFLAFQVAVRESHIGYFLIYICQVMRGEWGKETHR